MTKKQSSSIFVIIAGILLMVCGCYVRPVQPREETIKRRERQPEPKPKPKPEPIIPIQDPIGHAIPPVQVTAPANIVDAIFQVLGESGELPNQKPLLVSSNGTTIKIPVGGSMTYAHEANGSFMFRFQDPKPTIQIKGLKWLVTPPLLDIRLLPDNSGIARVGTAFGDVKRKFKIDWESEESATSEAEKALLPPQPKIIKPMIIMFTLPHCSACIRAKKEFHEAVDLPFEVVEKSWEEKPANLGGGAPLFWWDATADEPTIAKPGKMLNGFSDLSRFITMWKSSRQPKTQKATGYKVSQTAASRWSVDGDFSPSKEELIRHLLNAPEHKGQFDEQRLQATSRDDLFLIHGLDHEKKW